MSKSQTTLQAEVYALAPNDPSGITQKEIHEALRVLVRCNDLVSLTAYKAMVNAVVVEAAAIKAGGDRRAPTAVRAGMVSDSTKLTQTLQYELPLWVYKCAASASAILSIEAWGLTADAECDAKIAAL